VVAAVACALCCALLLVTVVMMRRPTEQETPLRPPVVPSREEDRVVPAIDPAGTPIWLEEQDVLWHEIVCWPARRDRAVSRAEARRRMML
jgi:hypothetical protein